MAPVDEFERVFRVECQRRRNNGEEIPTWGEVKAYIKEKNLLTSDDVRDNKDVLKSKATEICTEVFSENTPAVISSTPSPKVSNKKRKAEAIVDSDQEKRPKKARKPTEKRSKKKEDSDIEESKPKAGKAGPKKSAKSRSKVKSKVTVESDEEEDGLEKEQIHAPRSASSIVGSDVEAVPEPPKSPEFVGETSPDEGGGSKAIPAAEVAELSDGDLSVLDDGSPVKPKKKKKVEPQTNRETKEKKGAGKGKEKVKKPKTKATEPEDPNEAEIKRLKSFVTACGVRKRWPKEFEGIEDNPKKQIARIKQILEDLGMTGRLSIEKAKTIRAKRELEEEIQEVVQFEARRGAGDGRPSRSKKEKPQISDDSASEDEEALAANRPARKKPNPLAFLDNQSDEE